MPGMRLRNAMGAVGVSLSFADFYLLFMVPRMRALVLGKASIDVRWSGADAIRGHLSA